MTRHAVLCLAGSVMVLAVAHNAQAQSAPAPCPIILAAGQGFGSGAAIASGKPGAGCSPVLHALPAPAFREPSYVAADGTTLVIHDDMERYADAASMGAYPYLYDGPFIAPVPAPSQTSTAVDLAHMQVISPGRGGVGQALRMNYDGVYQESHNFSVILLDQQPDDQTVYIQYYARITTPTPWPLTQPLAVKWLEAWHNHAGAHGARMQWNTRYPSQANTRQTAPTVWQALDMGESANNGDQPYGPFFHQLTDGQWHRFTHAFKPHTSAANKDGFSRMWIDGVLVIDVEQATVGITPVRGASPWCTQATVDDLAVGDGVATLVFGGPQTTPTGAWTYDIDDLTWWTARQ